MLKQTDKPLITTLGLVLFTALVGGILSSTTVTADDAPSSIDEVSISVPASCTISGTGNASHTAEISNGLYVNNIGSTTMKAFCNDASGFSVFAIGYTGDIAGSNVLTNSTSGTSHDINTSTATGPVGGVDNSAWAMKLGKVTTPSPAYPVILAGSSDDPDSSNTTDYSAYQEVPNTYTKVAYRTSGTDIGSGAEGSTFTTTYAVYISKTQPAGTYTGKVKYTLVHPYTEPAPVEIIPPTSCNTPVPNVTFMQELSSMDSSQLASLKSSLTTDAQYYLADNRDNKSYCVSKLKDGNIWMTQNLDLDIDSSRTYTPADTDIPTDWTPIESTLATGETNWILTYQSGDTGYVESLVNNTPQSYDPGGKIWDGVVGSGTTLDDMNQGTNPHYHIGNYYNWMAAVATNDSRLFTNKIDVNQSICPAGWMLTKSSGVGSFNSLSSLYARWTESVYDEETDAWSIPERLPDQLWESPVYFTMGGQWMGDSWDVSNEGYYWTPKKDDSGASNYFVSQFFTEMSSPNHYFGLSVRCVSR